MWWVIPTIIICSLMLAILLILLLAVTIVNPEVIDEYALDDC